MNLSKAAMILCASSAATFLASPTVGAAEEGRAVRSRNKNPSGDNDHRNLKSAKKKKNQPGCITRAQMIFTIEQFMATVVNISNDWKANGGGPPATPEQVIDGICPNQLACDAVNRAAMGALNGAYAYNMYPNSVQFKPTLTSVDETYRNMIMGALSYFIGTECIKCSNPSMAFPMGSPIGTEFQEYGFGINNFNGGDGWTDARMNGFTYLTGGNFCDTALAMGRICFDQPPMPGRNSACVDKTFAFVRGGPGQFDAVIVNHHSSSVIVDGTITYCQAPPDFPFEPSMIPSLPMCPVPNVMPSF